jgi:hypothetical protein
LKYITTNENLVTTIRIYGLILQITGAITLIFSLKERLILFKGYGILELFKEYVCKFPRRKRKRNIIFKGYPVNVSVTTSEPHLSISPREELKDIIRYINEEVAFLNDKIKKIEKVNIERFSLLENRLQEINNNLSKELKETKKLISESSVSNVWRELFGISCIILGLIYSTIPDLVINIF